VVLHHLAACEGSDRLGRAPDDYVESVFDGFAISFDAKLASLGYRAPQLIASLVSKHLPPPARELLVGDAGCGTGLCGSLVRDWAASLVGFDLSAGMLALAEQRGVYDRLHKAELVDYLRRNPESFDLLVSADTLCYFGVLDKVFAASARALRDHGFLIFSVEAAAPADAPEGFRINPHGRYSHTRPYLESTLHEAGLVIVAVDAEVLRSENNLPVNGFVVSARRPPREDAAQRERG
jgi:predicted TPR repeat methyltransferase